MLSTFRSVRRLYHGGSNASLSITCRGTQIDREDLFAYTNGRFLVDEEHQLSRRYVRFNLEELCSTAASVGGSPSPVTAIDKREGGFSKALLMQKANGTEIVAKIPCRIAGPPSLTTAAEVGVLEYIRRNTSIPAPRVFAWSSNRAHPVGAEYILMEKAVGVPLFERWGDMSEYEQLQLIKNLTQLEAQLSAISFPAYVGLYLREKTSRPTMYLDTDIDQSQSFEIGPSCDRSFYSDMSSEYSRGPWRSISSFGTSIVQREIFRVLRGDQKVQQGYDRGTVEQQTRLLRITGDLM